MSTAEYQRAWRARHGARTGQPGPAPSQPCGTVAAFKRHKRKGETPCEACHDAYKAQQKLLYQKRKARAAN